MSLYQVLVTGAAYVEVEADNPDQAKQKASERLGEIRFGIWDMSLDFTCDESDLIDIEE